MSHQKNSPAKKVRMLRLIEEQEKSGQSQIEFCKNQKLSIATFGYWRKQYLKEKQESSKNTFIPIQLSPSKTSHPIAIELPNKIILRCEDWQSNNLPSLILQLHSLKMEERIC